jgi:hypothetical protein
MQPLEALACPPGPPVGHRISEHHSVRSGHGSDPLLKPGVLRIWQVVRQRKKPARGRL